MTTPTKEDGNDTGQVRSNEDVAETWAFVGNGGIDGEKVATKDLSPAAPKRRRVISPDLNVVVKGGQVFRVYRVSLALASPFLMGLITSLSGEEDTLSFPDMEADVWGLLSKLMEPFCLNPDSCTDDGELLVNNSGDDAGTTPHYMTYDNVFSLLPWLCKFGMKEVLRMLVARGYLQAMQSITELFDAIGVFLRCDLEIEATTSLRNFKKDYAQRSRAGLTMGQAYAYACYSLSSSSSMVDYQSSNYYSLGSVAGLEFEWTDADSETCKALFLDDETKELMWKICSDASILPAAMVNSPERNEFVQEKSFLAMIRFYLLGV